MSGLAKAQFEFEDGKTIDFQFNPDRLQISKTATWKALPATGRNAPASSEFVKGSPATLTLTLLLDSTDTGKSVTEATAQLRRLVELDTRNKDYDAGNSTGRPPWVKLIWGSMVPFPCICTSLSIAYTYFASNGEPLRAEVGISLRQFSDPDQPGPTNPTSGTPRPHKVHVVRRGETLDRIAAVHYGDASKWRQIASANTSVQDPLSLKPGQALLIPVRRRSEDD